MADAEAAHAVLVSSEDADTFALEGVPHVAVEVVVPGKEHPSRDRERDRCDAAQDIVVHVLVQLAVGAQVEQSTRRVVGTGRERVSVREESAGRVKRNESDRVRAAGESEKSRSTYETALISDSCPVKVWTALPVRMSHTFAVASHAPDTNTF